MCGWGIEGLQYHRFKSYESLDFRDWYDLERERCPYNRRVHGAIFAKPFRIEVNKYTGRDADIVGQTQIDIDACLTSVESIHSE